MKTFVLIIWIHAAILSNVDSMTMFSVPGFFTREACEQAGKDSKVLVRMTVKSLEYVCIEQPKI
jgi:hypothetical protein